MKLKCPECKAREFELNGEPFRLAGKRELLRCGKCGKCGYTSALPVPGEAPAPAAPEPTAPPPAEEPPAEDAPPAGADRPGLTPTEPTLVRVDDGFDPDDVADGDVCLAERGGEEVEILVNRVTAKMVICEIAGDPDIRVHKDNLLGRYE